MTGKVGTWIKIVGIIVWILGGLAGLIGLVGTAGQHYTAGTRMITFLLFMLPGAIIFRIGRWIERRAMQEGTHTSMADTDEG